MKVEEKDNFIANLWRVSLLKTSKIHDRVLMNCKLLASEFIKFVKYIFMSKCKWVKKSAEYIIFLWLMKTWSRNMNREIVIVWNSET